MGCKNNSIYFDLQSSEIVSCSNNRITKIIIKNMKTFDLFILNSKGDDKISSINLNKINDLFSIEASDESHRLIMNEPYTLYSIMNTTNGDAAHYEVLILTDSLGNFSETSRPDCISYNPNLNI